MTINEQKFHWKNPILDSGCRMLDDQAMAEKWIVRVHGKEYGPVDIETLREWKTEGRLLPGNEARPVDVDLAAATASAEAALWTTAAEIPGLFDAGALAAASARRPLLQARRCFAQILAETFRIYGRGVLQFLPLTLLVVLPWVCG